MLSNKTINTQNPKLHSEIRLTVGINHSFLPCHIKLATMLLQVPAKAQIKMPANPKTLRMVLLIAFSIGPLVSINKKNTSQVVRLMIN